VKTGIGTETHSHWRKDKGKLEKRGSVQTTTETSQRIKEGKGQSYRKKRRAGRGGNKQ